MLSSDTQRKQTLPFSTRLLPRRSSSPMLSACHSVPSSKLMTRFLRSMTSTQTMTRSISDSFSDWETGGWQATLFTSASRRCSRSWVSGSNSIRMMNRSRRPRRIRTVENTRKSAQAKCCQRRRRAHAEDRDAPPSIPRTTRVTRLHSGASGATHPDHLCRNSISVALPPLRRDLRRGRPQGRRRDHSRRINRQVQQLLKPGGAG